MLQLSDKIRDKFIFLVKYIIFFYHEKRKTKLSWLTNSRLERVCPSYFAQWKSRVNAEEKPERVAQSLNRSETKFLPYPVPASRRPIPAAFLARFEIRPVTRSPLRNNCILRASRDEAAATPFSAALPPRPLLFIRLRGLLFAWAVRKKRARAGWFREARATRVADECAAKS